MLLCEWPKESYNWLVDWSLSWLAYTFSYNWDQWSKHSDSPGRASFITGIDSFPSISLSLFFFKWLWPVININFKSTKSLNLAKDVTEHFAQSKRKATDPFGASLTPSRELQWPGKRSNEKKPWTDLCFESRTSLQVVTEKCSAYTAPLMSHKSRRENLFCLLSQHCPASMTQNISLALTMSYFLSLLPSHMRYFNMTRKP